MKKSILLLFCLICLTGCEKNVICTKENKTEDYTTKLESIYSYKKNTLTGIYKSSIFEFKSENEAKEYYNQYKETLDFYKEHGNKDDIEMLEKSKISQEKKTVKIEIVYNEEEIKEEIKSNKNFYLTKEEYIKTFEEDGYECK